MPTILFTGGGSSGHVTPNVGIIEKLQAEQDIKVAYIGSYTGIEKQIIEAINVPYYGIASGKLRRYFSFKTLIEPFKILWATVQAYRLVHKIKPAVLFSKGGFVAVPVVIAAWLRRVPVIIHEADFTPGLANKLCLPFAKKVCLTFPESERFFSHKDKLVVTGLPIRKTLFTGDAEQGREFCGFNQGKPIILVTGGGLGAQRINEVVRSALPTLLQQFQIVHLCGQGKLDQSVNHPGYRQFEYINEQFGDLMACADLVISRSGSNGLMEIISLRKLNVLIPLPKGGSRGDQIDNALYFADRGISHIIWQQDLNSQSLVSAIHEVFSRQADIKKKLSEMTLPDAIQNIVQLLLAFSAK